MTTGRSKYSFFGRINFEDLYNAFLNLDQRRQILTVGVGVLLILLVIFLPITCATSRLSGLERDFEKGKKISESLMGKIAAYQSAKGELDTLKQKFASTAGGSLTTVVETLANEAGIGDKIERLKPTQVGSTDYFDEEGVDAVVSKVTLGQATDFLEKVENYAQLPMRIKKLQLKPRYGSRDELTVTLQISTLRVKGGEAEEETAKGGDEGE